MGKADAAKSFKSIPNKHIHSRISYLYQAASYLSAQQQSLSNLPQEISNAHDPRTQTTDSQQPCTNQVIPVGLKPDGLPASCTSTTASPFPPGLPFHLLSQLHSISLKSQLRLSSAVKHSICRRCNALLVPGYSSMSQIENLSRGRKKAWADVLVVTCNICGAQKRFPVGSRRQPKKSDRVSQAYLYEGESKTLELSGHPSDTRVTSKVEELSLVCSV